MVHPVLAQLWLVNLLCNRYHVITSDVLTSIKRTEDSLMRLKRSRKQLGSGIGGQGTNQEGQSVISDDDKIRLQFTLDTEEFGQAVSCLFFLFVCLFFSLLGSLVVLSSFD